MFRYEQEKPQMRLYVEPDGRILLRSGWPIKHRDELIIVEQKEHGRMLEYTRTRGRLSQVVFPDMDHVDLQELPQDETIPSDAKLVELFNAHNITPQIPEDLIPV